MVFNILHLMCRLRFSAPKMVVWCCRLWGTWSHKVSYLLECYGSFSSWRHSPRILQKSEVYERNNTFRSDNRSPEAPLSHHRMIIVQLPPRTIVYTHTCPWRELASSSTGKFQTQQPYEIWSGREKCQANDAPDRTLPI